MLLLIMGSILSFIIIKPGSGYVESMSQQICCYGGSSTCVAGPSLVSGYVTQVDKYGGVRSFLMNYYGINFKVGDTLRLLNGDDEAIIEVTRVSSYLDETISCQFGDPIHSG